MNYIENLHFEKAKKHIAQGNFQEANNEINELLNVGEESAELYKNVGMLYIAIGQYPFASVYIRHSFDLEKTFETLELLANTNYKAEKYDLAAVQFEELVKYYPRKEFFKNCIDCYEKLDFYEEAIRVAQMYNYTAQSAESYANLIFMYITAGMEELAINTTEEMQKKFPNSSLTFNTLGFLHECIYIDYKKAKYYFEKAAKYGFIDAYYNLGVCCKQSEDLEGAEKNLKRLITLNSDSHSDYNYTYGSIFLSQRKLRQGYKYYTKRNALKEIISDKKDYLWDGKDYPKETLYILSEQGFGDNILFARYIPLAAKKFKKVIHTTYPELVELFKRSYSDKKYKNIEFVSNNDIVKYNKIAFITDLPYLLNESFHQIPADIPYLVSSERKEKLFKTNFFKTDKTKIGLCWCAKGMGLRDSVYKTIDAPYYFKSFIDAEKAEFYSFQKNDIFDMCKKYPDIKDLSPHLNDFEDTAAALKNIDILITVDTAIAHLAGALGVKTYLLLCHAPDWKWFDNTEKTEWYPTITIIKQHDRKTWDDVAEKLNKYLQKDLKKKK